MLILGIELIIVALLVYYIRMVGQHRLRIAFGGISLGLGAFVAFVAYLIGIGSIVLQGVSPEVTTLVFYVLLFISMVQIMAGALNMTLSDR